MSQRLPVILCGRTEQIGAVVIESLRPEIEVTHFILSPESGAQQIPALLRGEKQVPSNSSLGSRNYEKGVSAIILGAGYDDQAIQKLRHAAKGSKPVPWLRPDMSKPAPPLGPEYGKALVARIKETFVDLQKSARLDEDVEVYY